MQEQNYSNHARYVPGFHFLLSGIIFLSLIGACVNLYHSLNDHANLYSASLLVVVFVCLLIMYVYVRQFPLKAQDRAIRAEENLRHFVMTGRMLDSRLTMRQVIGLRFASDEEFVELSKRAANENLSEDQIKKTIKNWRPDNYRL
ncbi:MAG: DUF6526 family protein [Candidatus Zixiibacteriota bacterium]